MVSGCDVVSRAGVRNKVVPVWVESGSFLPV